MSYQRLKTDINGGFPLVLDDIRWLQGEFESPFMNYLENICPVDGAVWIRGGAFPIPPGSIGITSGVAYISGTGFVNVVGNNSAGWNGTTTFLRPAASTFNPAGNKTFQDGSVNDVYELPRYTVSTGTAGVGDVILNNWVYLNQTFDEKIVTFASGITVFSSQFEITINANKVTISCSLSGPAGTRTTAELLFTLNNTIFDPKNVAISWAAGGGSGFLPVSINTSGEVLAQFNAFNEEYPIGFEITATI
jgi:hypothetical protein